MLETVLKIAIVLKIRVSRYTYDEIENPPPSPHRD